MTDQDYMLLALDEARQAETLGEVPVGAVIVREGLVIARGHNRNILDHDPTAHAEIVVMREAAKTLGNHRVLGCTLFATIEPCAMCAGAMVHARIARLVYGAADPKAGAVQSALQVVNHPALNHRMEITSGLLQPECAELLQSFFRRKRDGAQ